ncbi:cytochrome c biogenesis heme-transporting ATPase CcmA [Catenovulum sp. 2E275]|uniref:cytochrome c biogenesis heme-transporting ATPase CcmA n=1 Tax=Catenovulum sp. 2E275 TaxID=2980497 RepID=UPI0021CE4277|nr:cytochrome c biogenesis heme-transporting ATPase CcmA [Catenovulum sp. 2E275]MCU4675791.1 cytochrome c biogenesis heme-transporting ATPase CcmA [Catenovulum sp. 2E275]
MLSANQLTCIRNQRILFDELSFELEAGQLMYLTGPNGAGKTTLLRSLVGLQHLQQGQVLLDNMPISDCSEQILYIGHKPAVNEWLSAKQNLAHWFELSGQTADCEMLLNKVGLGGLMDLPVKFLSAGQKRRVALVRMWQSNAKLWVLDEPFTSIDIKGVDVLNQLFLRHKQNGGYVIVTSHQTLPDNLVDRTLNLEYRF